MDPLSLTASLIAVGQATQTGVNTIEKIKALLPKATESTGQMP